ncbi:MAG TPA: HDOD domain-containing protein [Hydrogenophaga sp.]|uniref:HDOD domain-containing protein n=1 Tax=Hydrogenophaga sp. TaxID=1904254 RepID=UPI002BB03175|nr:HDOD domain-containing protein [Hydrogenophaga sp.]HMN93980.1 HDOD domain-containing protein [Hydrogenophaga sp.]HMP09400.1 HDOD domain-containing protein [Hydrogenophaga sp.]
MSAFILWIAAVLALALLWWAFRRKPGHAAAATQRSSVVPDATIGQAPSGPRASQVPAAPPVCELSPSVGWATAPEPPAALSRLVWRQPEDLEVSRREQLVQAIRGIPRPPRSLQQLISPDFVAKADSTQLADLVMAEPLIAAKVLGAVNSSRYGLEKPIAHLGQAVTFLGMNSVRSICLQYMLAEAFKPGLASAQKAFDTLWASCGRASELAVHLGKAMNLPQQAGLATQVVLGFVGQLAAASLLPANRLQHWLEADRVGRTELEQELLGLNASELGQLLMQNWSLPAALIADVGASGRVLVTPAGQVDTTRVPTLGLAYLCAHLGEHPADARTEDHTQLMQGVTGRADTHHLAGYLNHPALSRLPAGLLSVEVQACLAQSLQAQSSSPPQPTQAEVAVA